MAITKITSSVIEDGSISHSSLTDSGVTAGTHGHSAGIPVLDINSKGIITGVSVVDVAGVSSVTYNSSSGVLTIATTDGSNFNVDLSIGSEDSLSITDLTVVNTITGQVSSIANHDTGDLSEGTNLYYTDARARAAISASDGVTYNSTTGAFTLTDSGVTAGSYGSASQVPIITVDANGRITSASTTSVAGVSSFSYDAGTEVLTIATADGGSFNADISSLASQGYVDTAVSNLVDTAPATLDTLNELAAALGDDPNFATTTATNIGNKANKTLTVSAGGGLTGGGDLTANRIISHADTSSQASVNNSNGTVIQDITLDTYGHLTGIASANLDDRYYTETEADSRFVNITGDTMTGSLTIPGALKITETGTSQKLLIGNQDSSGVNKPAMLLGINGQLQLGYGNSWSGEGGTFTSKLTVGSDGVKHNGTDLIFHDGYHPNADKWTTARTITLGGDLSGSVSIDGSANATLNVNIADATVLSQGGDITGSTDWDSFINSTEASWNNVFNFAGANGPSGAYTYGTALSFSDNGRNAFQLYAPENASSGNGLRYRTTWNNASRPWVKIWDSGNDGSGSGLDADTVDGIQAGSFLRSDTDDLSFGRLAIKTGQQYSVGGNHELSLLNSMAIGPSNSDLVYFRYQGAAGEYAIQTYNSGNGGELHLQPYGGNVGIGTASPTAKLDVAGGGLSVSGWSNNNSGTSGGLEAGWDGSKVVLQSYDRVNGNYEPMLLSASYVTLPTNTSDPASPVTGSTYFNTTDNALKIYGSNNAWGAVAFASLGSEQNPASSAVAILNDNPSSADGAYWIDTGSGATEIYCWMTGGGYMLAAKIDANQDNNWAYTGGNWTTSSPINESSCSNINGNDAVHRIYYEYTMTTGMRLSLNDPLNNYLSETSHPLGKTAKESFTTTGASDHSRSNFLTWIANAGTPASNWDNQGNCNHTGFNISGASYQNRWGINLNNEVNCSSNDAAIGMGTYTNSQITSGDGIRNVNSGAHRWSPDARYPYNGFIWVK